MAERMKQQHFLESLLIQLLEHLEQENVRRSINCAQLFVNNKRLRAKSKEHVEHILAHLSVGILHFDLKRQQQVQQACTGVLAECMEQVEQAKGQAEQQYNECCATDEKQILDNPQYDVYTMMPYHDVEAEIKRLLAEKVCIEAETTCIRETEANNRLEIEARIKEVEAEHKMFAELIAELNDTAHKLNLELQQAQQKNQVPCKQLKQLEAEIAMLEQELQLAKSM